MKILFGRRVFVFGVCLHCMNLAATKEYSKLIGENMKDEKMTETNSNPLQISKNTPNDVLNEFAMEGIEIVDEVKRSETVGRDDQKQKEKNEETENEGEMGKKTYINQESEIECCVKSSNSSIVLKCLLLKEKGAKRMLIARGGSVVSMRECILFVGQHSQPIELEGSFGSFANISLMPNAEGLNTFPPLFTSKQTENSVSKSSIISLSESHFSSFCVSSAPFLSSPSIPLVSLSKLTFFNISTANEACLPSTTMSTQTTCFMSSCSFTSVCDAYDGGIVHSLNNPSSSLSASNISFIGCCRTRNVVCEGTAEAPLKPERQSITENIANTFTWCEWNESKTTGEIDSNTDGISSGGAICMHNLNSGELSVSNCLFNNCFAYSRGGGIMCNTIKSVHIENDVFNACSAQNRYGGGLYAVTISTCVRISGCEFQNCKANGAGGGLDLDYFQVSVQGCIGAENGGGEGACVFDCIFTSCSVTGNDGGGMRCANIPATLYKMRSIQFISCTATAYGGGLYFNPNRATTQNETMYCYFLLFHECKCRTESNPYGHDMVYADYNNDFLSSKNPLYDCYTTNTDNKRVCYGYNYVNAGDWTYDQTSKKDWLKDKTIYVSVNGNDEYELCGANESYPCLTVKKAFDMCEVQISLIITLLEGDHTRETTTIEIETKKISVIGKGRTESSIGTGALSSTGSLFSVSTGHLGLLHMKVDCYSNENPSLSVVVISDGSGSLSLEDVVITTRNTGEYVQSSSVFVVPLSQLSMVSVEIINMNISKSLFSESDISSSSSSSALFLTATTSEESVLANLSVKNVKLTSGDGVVVEKSVKEGETFVVTNITIEDCMCKNGSGGGIKVDLSSPSSKFQMEATTTINRCKCSGYGGGMMLYLADGSHDFSIYTVDFEGCTASLGGNYLFVNGSNSMNWGITTEKLNVQYDNSKYNEIVGYDRSDTIMGLFPLNVFLDEHEGSAHVGKENDGLGGYNSWFCGFDYYPCATITHAAQMRFPDTNKKIQLDSGYELAEEVAMADAFEWEISCATKGMEVGVKKPENFESSCLIEVQSKFSMKNIKFCIPSLLSGASSMISSNSTLLTLTDCSVAHLSENAVSGSIGYSFAKVERGSLRLVRFEVKETLRFGEHSLIEFAEGVDVVYFTGCNVSNVEKRNGDGGWLSGVVGAERGEGLNGIVVIESCVAKRCSCLGGSGGGGSVCVSVKGEGSAVVNGTSVIDGCEAMSLDGSGGRGGGMMIVMGSTLSLLKIESGVHFSVDAANRAKYGKDVFVCCSSGILLESKVNESSFGFFDSASIPSDVLELCGSENGKEEEVIPLFVYLCSIGSKLTVDGSGERALDHSHCGFEKFGCVTIDYCVSKRANNTIHEIEVASESSIKNEMKVASFDVSLSGKEEWMKVIVRDEGSMNQNNLIECTKPFEMINLAFVLNEEMNGRRSGFIHSSSAIVTITRCSVTFANDEMIGYNVINIEGGGLIANGFVMEGGVRMNGKSPIVITNGVEFEMKNNRMSGVEVKGGIGGGCLNVKMKEGVDVNIEECNLSSVCSGGSGTKGGGMMITVGSGGSLKMKEVKFEGCEVPSGESDEVGRGMGGGMFVKLPDEMGSFMLEQMTFEGCDAWKGKNVFVSGWNLSEIVNEEHFKWEIKEEELGSLDELCGWERKTTGEEGHVIPLVVYLWRNWSGDGFVSREKGGDFSGCGYSEAPCTSIDHLISMRYSTLEEGETHIVIVGSGLLRRSISFSFLSSSSSILEKPKVVVDGAKKGTGVMISDEDENELDDGSMISSNVSLSFVNVSFTKPSITTHHEVFIESSGTSSLLSVADCSFGSLTGLTETAGYCLMKANGGSVVIERSSLSLISELKGFICFSPSVCQMTLQNVNISFADVKERSLISMMEEENQMNEKVNNHSNANGNRPVLRVVGCSFANITNEGIGASVIDVGSFEHGVECVMDECSITNCKSASSAEGGGMRVALKREESVLKVNGSSFSMCKCSTGSGCGGGLYIDGYDPNANYGNETQIPPLKFKIVNILFVMNEAHVGKDIFIKCFSIAHQINETLFALNYNQESLNSNNSICGRDVESEGDVDLIPLTTFYYSAQVFVSGRGSDDRRCGSQTNPCSSINCVVDHIEQGVMNAILIDGEGAVTKECVIGDLIVNPFKKTQAIVRLKSKIEKSFEKDCIMEFVNECFVERCSFQFEDGFESTHSYLIKVKNGSMEIHKCEFISSIDELKLNNSVMSVESGELKISETSFRDLRSTSALLFFNKESNVTIDETRIWNIECEGDVVSVGGKAKVEIKEMVVENVTLLSNGCVIAMEDAEQEVSVLNCSLEKCVNSVEKGRMMQIRRSKDARIETCVFDGEKDEEIINEEVERMKEEGLCKWNGSLIDVEKSNVEMRETTAMKSKEGGLRVSGGSVKIEKGEFENNNPEIEGYPSARRNAICEGNGELDVVSVKGGDGMLPNTSLWILDEGCQFGGIAGERGSSFFIPVLEEVKNSTQPNGEMELVILGKLLLPCGLSLRLNMKEGDVELPYSSTITEDGYISENEVHSMISSELLKVMENKTEVRMCLLFGKADSPSSTDSFILKNKSESQSSGNEKLAESGKGSNLSWALIIAVIFVVLFLIVLIVAVAFIVRWRKQKRRTKELEIIVEDTVKKDPKAFEMVTMEMSPEAQWRRAEREAEKKNEERIKKRVYENSLGHSESSEHLLSESGSTEYILGQDSDKIPKWMLEKVDEKEEEEEETRKRTPSPSISSTSTTDTSDTESTFVRGEDLCPTTSSMSNLVDAMACSSPHEKLIVDLRDSLFMLLHGRNAKKEMAIGTFEEREQTAAQILFWVDNLALHSFDEMEKPLSSLSNLSPHIVLFSEHMVICIVMHSDLLLSDDSDSSLISSSTVVTSASDDDDDDDSLPSSAFEDDDYYKKECLRWKAPELLINKKMGATKETVSFSIGMMLWECLTLKVPFGEYEAEVAGQKIVNGERPRGEIIEQSHLSLVVNSCWSDKASERMSLNALKREFIQCFPPGAAILTMTDAIALEESGEEEGNESAAKSGEEDESLDSQQSRL
ncbi:uncharacterized protein MONOS_4378 [Monocercomonoides exilis]|uniref:uncharacterized protein n=1 Tax=Monocercomonoides exilis TaxID=2049356 RepID=UPI003559CCB5|nr:hypothetical protein MONOS_4378 [Monocercomonoides exilis]|eukprot:MONOS_4378.1-p1 / transcript=MONOS_4378.1 / gene=MONOS_4378 / organism=Monocercomonoides_exilis_PA203 / gene_product=unspecified product / transcript_product=unspecified product / location=Mono_scaffold00115:110923-120090(-) / protein_length=3055 / sequence_SO=supercontig / SO=protein_coding / is_pseudo=false